VLYDVADTYQLLNTRSYMTKRTAYTHRINLELSRYGDYATDCVTEESKCDSRQGQKVFCVPKNSYRLLGPPSLLFRVHKERP
jgi:hypothetical protein